MTFLKVDVPVPGAPDPGDVTDKAGDLSTWLASQGKPVFVNHHNANHRRARGVIVAIALHRDRNPDGSPAMSYEKALTLKLTPLNAIFSAVVEVNGSGSGKP